MMEKKRYEWKDFPYEEFVERYQILGTDHKEEDLMNTPYVMGTGHIDLKYKLGKLSEEEYQEELKKADYYFHHPVTSDVKAIEGIEKDTTLVINKCKALQHAIIRRCSIYKNPSYFIELSGAALQAMLGGSYNHLLYTLLHMQYITVANHGQYKPGESAITYYVNEEKEIQEVPYDSNKKIQQMIEKLDTFLDNAAKEQVQEQADKLGLDQGFLESYRKSLNNFKLKDTKEFEEYLKIDQIESRKVYNNYIFLEANKKKSIHKIDRQGRIYHYFTNLRRGYKEYFNIAYAMDCKNSHPLLFNYIIFYFNNINVDLSYKISSLFKELYKIDNSIHYDGNYLYNFLLVNNIQKQEIAELSIDELEYIYQTSNGLLWDNVIAWAERQEDLKESIREGLETGLTPEQEQEEIRAEVKTSMFAEVFYVKNPKLYRDKTTGEVKKKYADYFSHIFPTVYELIARFKKKVLDPDVIRYLKEHQVAYDDSKSSLSLAMMKLESSVFKEILYAIYRKRKSAINIHDCILVPDVKNAPDQETTLRIMEAEYKKIGLCPTFSTDTYEEQ